MQQGPPRAGAAVSGGPRGLQQAPLQPMASMPEQQQQHQARAVRQGRSSKTWSLQQGGAWQHQQHAQLEAQRRFAPQGVAVTGPSCHRHQAGLLRPAWQSKARRPASSAPQPQAAARVTDSLQPKHTQQGEQIGESGVPISLGVQPSGIVTHRSSQKQQSGLV